MFKVKDLMIKVIPAESERPDYRLPGFDVGWCLITCDPTCADTCGCTTTCWGCSQCSPPSGGNMPGELARIDPADLPALKAQLQQRISMIDALQKSLEPRSIEEVETLETKLKDALEEVRRMKAALAGKQP